MAARRRLFTWFGGLAPSARAGIAAAAFVTMSAGVLLGLPYTPSSAPWLKPTVAPSETVQTPSVLKPSIVPAATTSAQAKTPSAATTAPQTTRSVYYEDCAQASKSGAAPMTSGQPGYRPELDLKRNGVACESK